MNSIDYRQLAEQAGHYFASCVRDVLDIPVRNHQFEVMEENGETYHVLRVVNIDGDYHVFVQRRGDMIVDTESMPRHDMEWYRQLAFE